MYIEPNSIIKIYHNVPLDNTYNHTLYFANKSAQNVYFHEDSLQNILKFRVETQSYQRVVKGSMRVALNSDKLYDCNYLAFQNTSFGQKWFYAFITGVEYINNETSEITFEIDVMQTYMFDTEVKECFVEREHSETDNVGEHLQSEPINIGDSVCVEIGETNYFNSYSVVIATTYEPNDGMAGGYQGGLFSGVNYVVADVNNSEQVQNVLHMLDNLTKLNEQDSVISIFMMPSVFYPEGEAPHVEVTVFPKNTKLHSSYEPRNKKLLTYPYNYFTVDCGDNCANYRYEWFTNSQSCPFEILSTITCNPQIALVPQNYNGVNNGNFNYVEKLVMKDFPQIAWSIDSFKAWLAQDASTTAIQGIASLGTLIGGTASANPAIMLGGAYGLLSTANQIFQADNRPNQAKGTSTGGIDVATRTKNFYFRRMQVTLEMAKVIDDYFDVYGYACRRVKVPNIKSRPHWNYVKTRDCVIRGNAPVDDIKKIASIYDNGVTFWKSAREVGDYSLDNTPVEE